MVATAIAASPIRAQARARFEGILAFLATAKNVPAHATDLAAIAEAMLGRANEQLSRELIQMPSGAVSRALLGSLDESLDWIAARNIVKLFAHVARLPLGASELQTLVVGLQLAAKDRQTRQGLALRWPDAHALEAAALDCAAVSAPRSANELEAGMTQSLRALELQWFEPALQTRSGT
jgi:hypothetical protein